MKRVLIGVAAVLVIVVAVIIAIPFFVPLDAIRDRLVAEVKASTGRDLAIDGPVDFSVFPSVAVKLSDVSLSNAPGASRPDMISLGQLDVEVGLLPILSGDIDIRRLILRQPIIALEIDQDGRGNWEFDVPEGAGPADPSAAPSGTGEAESEDGITLSDLRLGEVGIVDGTILFADRASGQVLEASALGLKLQWESLESPLAVSGSFDFQERRVEIALDADRPTAVIEGGESSLAASISSDELRLSFEGMLAAALATEVKGRLSVSVPSIAALADWLTIPVSEAGLPVDTLTVESELTASANSVALQTATLNIDDLAASGDLAVGLDGPRPALFGRLAVDQLALDRFFDADDAPAEQAETGTDGSAEGAAEGWSDEPIDFSPLRLFDADLVIASEGVTLRGVEAGPTALTTKLNAGVLDFDLSRTSLFGGHIALQLGADATAPTPSVRIGVQIDEVQAEPVLVSFTGFDRLTGAASAQFDLTSAGHSERALVEALNGTANVMLRDGSIRGVNLAAMVRNVASEFADPQAGETRATDFAELGGSFRITDGVARSADVRLTAPLLRMDGTARANLLPRTLAARLVPKFVADPEGQGGDAEGYGVAVPVIVEGPFDDLTYRPDVAAMITDTLQDPEAQREQLEGLVDQLRDSTGDVSPEDAVRNLLQGLTGSPQGQ